VTTDTRAHQARPTTDVDHIANNYLDALVELSPITRAPDIGDLIAADAAV
jgi:hypothetical protein